MRIRIKSPNKIALDSAMMNVAMVCITSFAMLEHASLSIPIFSLLKLPMLWLSAVCMLPQIVLILRNWNKKRYFSVLLVLLALCCVITFSTVRDDEFNASANALRPMLRLLLYLLELFIFTMYVAEHQKFKYVVNFLFWFAAILAFLNDFILFTGIIRFPTDDVELYLVGNKFSVAYLHMNLIALWYIRNNVRSFRDAQAKRFLYLMIPVIFVVSVRVDCMTGVVGSLLLFIFYTILDTDRQRGLIMFTSPGMLLAVLIATIVFPFVISEIMKLPTVTYIVTEVLNRSDSLTGRIPAYSLFAEKMQGFWLWGAGYGNGNRAAEYLFRIANAQNAQIQWVLQCGLISIFLIDTLLLMIFRQLHRSSMRKEITPLAVLIFVYIILGSVETTFNMNFFLWTMLILAGVNQKKSEYFLRKRMKNDG